MVFGVAAAILANSAFAGVSENDETHDYPTHIRVRYVIECMARNGGESFGNLYKCSCTIDKIAQQLTLSQFTYDETYLRGKKAGGERGEVLREGRGADAARSQLIKAEQKAVTECFPDGGYNKKGDSGDHD